MLSINCNTSLYKMSNTKVADGIGNGETERDVAADVDGISSLACADGLCWPTENHHSVSDSLSRFVLRERRGWRLPETIGWPTGHLFVPGWHPAFRWRSHGRPFSSQHSRPLFDYSRCYSFYRGKGMSNLCQVLGKYVSQPIVSIDCSPVVELKFYLWWNELTFEQMTNLIFSKVGLFQ